MKLVVTEKNDAAQKIADLLGVKKPKADKVYSTPVYRFDVDGEEWVTIGLRGHILEPDFTPTMVYKKRGGWQGVTEEGETFPRDSCPRRCPSPPSRRRSPSPRTAWSSRPGRWTRCRTSVYAPIKKLPKEKEIIRSLEEPGEEGRLHHHRHRLRPRGRAHRKRRALLHPGGEPRRARVARAVLGVHERGDHARLRQPGGAGREPGRPPARRARTSTSSGARCSRATSRS